MVNLKTKLENFGPTVRYSKVIEEIFHLKTIDHFIHFYPLRYIDRSQTKPIANLTSNDNEVQIRGVLKSIRYEGQPPKQRLTALLEDSHINTTVSNPFGFNRTKLKLVWFKNIDWICKALKPDHQYVAFGKLNWFHDTPSMIHPNLNLYSHYRQKNDKPITPVYPSSAKFSEVYLTQEKWIKCIEAVFNIPTIEITESLPHYLREKYGLMAKKEALKNIHFPADHQAQERAKERLKFEETFFLQMRMRTNTQERREKKNGFLIKKIGSHFNSFYNHKLDFELTNAQKRVIKEILEDFRQGVQMNRLLQGDVGSGKTIVALVAALLAIDSHYQVALIAPTEILAQQHFKTFVQYLPDSIKNYHLLTGSTPPSERNAILRGMVHGFSPILIGTHAILEDWVAFKNLGLVIIDEQHRFGVKQRAKLWTKSIDEKRLPHILLMSATPIPRTLAHTFYGDLDLSILNELPPGRKPIHTKYFNSNKRSQINEFLAYQIQEKRQVFVVYPLIEESEKLDLLHLEEGYHQMIKTFPSPQYRVNMMHGKMKSLQKTAIMQQFKEGGIDILLSTTVIEVGVDVPNATVMMIENAERFGLSQLHQLRGRVGRGASKSYCLLVSNSKLSENAKARIKIMTQTNDGFKIAEEDLRLRGAGDLLGVRQSGLALYRLTEPTEMEYIDRQKRIAEVILKNDPFLTTEENAPIKKELQRLPKQQSFWSK
ncbi:MAG: ATP-dependent DNA helicase RecG [Flavobacteriaceae bacterium]|nr:ATP-dependent DNA helicase RecG [Flavobacteriaceae bacterium]